ncbi:hypothetical protein AC578_4973 [Pseudocercospora eumusae]|uniref:Uncharacterized protein n=1 Tax=Pseudocercospora eumusae TaxID=321146 RepID=A0A139GTM6_9PEZI|nr:hypothetical protein AC578_4973 [Pseudocercospora eumusae]
MTMNVETGHCQEFRRLVIWIAKKSNEYMNNTILEASPYTSNEITFQNSIISDNTMGCECHQRLQSTPGAIHQQPQVSNGNLTTDAAETFPASRTSRSSTPTMKESDSPTNTPYNSVTSTDANSQRVAYAESTPNDESNGLSAYDKDNMERHRGSRASGLSAGSSAATASRSAWGEHRMSQDEKVWAQDKERKHGKLFEKIFDHKLAPDFLK